MRGKVVLVQILLSRFFRGSWTVRPRCASPARFSEAEDQVPNDQLGDPLSMKHGDRGRERKKARGKQIIHWCASGEFSLTGGFV